MIPFPAHRDNRVCGQHTRLYRTLARQSGQVRQASEEGAAWAGAVLDARGFVAVKETTSASVSRCASHLSRIERQPVCEGELVAVEEPAGSSGMEATRVRGEAVMCERRWRDRQW